MEKKKGKKKKKTEFNLQINFLIFGYLVDCLYFQQGMSSSNGLTVPVNIRQKTSNSMSQVSYLLHIIYYFPYQ